MIPHDVWRFTDEDRARLQPLLEKMIRVANRLVRRACEIADTAEGRLAIIQGGCEYIAEQLRELILQQVDRGEWAARGINVRADVDIMIHVDAAAAVADPDANLLRLSMQPTALRVN